MTNLRIKNMVCNRCVLVVKAEIENLGHKIFFIELGEVILKETVSDNDKLVISKQLETFGFEILNDSNSKLIEKIKTILIDLVQNKNNMIKMSLSDYLIDNLHQDYSKLSNLFSQIEGVSIEKYFINLKIEKVKELIAYDELSLSEIANYLNYSSVSHLSHQFKNTTGYSFTYFKNNEGRKRIGLDQL